MCFGIAGTANAYRTFATKSSEVVKCTSLSPNLVLVSDQLLPRSMWCAGRIQEVEKDGHVRSATVKVARFKSSNDLKIGSSVFLNHQ